MTSWENFPVSPASRPAFKEQTERTNPDGANREV